MRLKDKINIGIIGCGKIAQVRHIPEYKDNRDAVLYGFYDYSRDRTEKMADIYGGRVYDSWEEMLADENIDAVSVCTINQTHAEISIRALEAGKHVLCEKPIATTLEDCIAMTEASKKTGRLLMIDQNQRLAMAHIQAKRMIDDGVIGRVISFRTTFGHSGPETWSIEPGKNTWFFDKGKSAMGVMADLGVHKTDLIQFLTSQRVVEVAAKLSTLDKRDASGDLIGVDDNAICIYTLSNGIVGTMTASWTYYGSEDNSTIIYGTNGILHIYDDPEHSIVFEAKDGSCEEYEAEAIQTNESQTKSGVIDLFIDCIAHGKEGAITGESVLNAMKAVFAGIESSKTGRAVRIE